MSAALLPNFSLLESRTFLPATGTQRVGTKGSRATQPFIICSKTGKKNDLLFSDKALKLLRIPPATLPLLFAWLLPSLKEKM